MLIFIIFSCVRITLSCRPQDEILNMTNNKFFSNSSTWGGWDPPDGNNSWIAWIILWGSENSSWFDSTEEGQEPKTGWLQYWKVLGKDNSGVPPPPWAYVPLSYGKPEYCFLKPVKGDCEGIFLRWAYNPTTNQCQLFEYSGCNGNQNNFNDENTCKKNCVEIPSNDCEILSKIKFEEMIYD